MPAKQTKPTPQRQQLAAWLAAYELDRQLRESHVLEQPPTSAVCEIPRIPTAYGQIRLLPPATASIPEIERPVYVLLLPSTQDLTTNIVPFSRFDIPATPQEWCTGLSQTALQVLCLWNAREIDTAALVSTWLVCSVTEKQLQQAIGAYQNPPVLATDATYRFGPPLRHPLDPRHTYLQEERMLIDDLCVALQEADAGDNTIPYRIPEPDVQLLRAADAPQYPQAEDDTD